VQQRRVPLTRLTQRQRAARWQRERRQQAVVVTVFGAILFFVLGLAAWAASDRYYTQNLRPAARYAGEVVPWRDYQRELRYQLVKFYLDFGVPKEFENDSRIASQKAEYDSIALDRVLEQAALDRAAAAAGVRVSDADVDARYVADLSQYRARHVLVSLDNIVGDTPEQKDTAAREKAVQIVQQLRPAPNDQELWNTVAKEKSDDPGSKDSGGELGWVGKGQFVKPFEDAALTLAIGAVSDPVKSDFGYHVIQVEERRGPEQSDAMLRYRSSGFDVTDVKAHLRYDLLKEEFTKRAQASAVSSPTPQIHLLKIRVGTPRPTAQAADLEAFTAGLRKIADVNKAIEEKKDFGETAKELSEDPSAEKGGDIGWFARGMLTDTFAEDELFALDPGTVSRPFASVGESIYYKVVEKSESRALDDDQKKVLQDSAYTVWLAREKRANGAQRLVPGHEFDR
jgi:parvulin-like peptidyl-prolyl isomerase